MVGWLRTVSHTLMRLRQPRAVVNPQKVELSILGSLMSAWVPDVIMFVLF